MSSNVKKLLNKQNIFLLLLIGMVLAGRFIPYKEEYNRYFNLPSFLNWGIAFIFLLYGLKLNIKEVVKDISNWKLHLLVQFSTFILFPLLVLLFYGFAKDTVYYDTWTSVFFLASLPSTVSSSVVMVSIAKGNITSAIFNASISGLIGVLLTPLWMSFFLTPSSQAGGQLEIVLQLVQQVLVPIVIGILLNPLVKKWVKKYGKYIGEFDRFIILLIVYENFSKAFIQNIFSAVPSLTFLLIAVSVIGLFFSVYYIIKGIAKQLKFSREDAITSTFCGSKKSLIHGSLFVMVLSIHEHQKVLFLLPIMLYHSFQLFYVSWLANRLALEVENN